MSRPYRPQATGNMGIFWVSVGLFFGFFMFTEVGQLTAREAAKVAKGRVPPAEKWPLFRARGPPEVKKRPGEEKLPQQAVVYPGISKFTAKMMECIPEQMRGMNFGAYYADPDLQKELLSEANKCIDLKQVTSIMPKTFGDVGYVFKVNKEDPLQTEIRFITQGYPRKGQVYMMLLKGWADWVAEPGSIPMVSVER